MWDDDPGGRALWARASSRRCGASPTRRPAPRRGAPSFSSDPTSRSTTPRSRRWSFASTRSVEATAILPTAIPPPRRRRSDLVRRTLSSRSPRDRGCGSLGRSSGIRVRWRPATDRRRARGTDDGVGLVDEGWSDPLGLQARAEDLGGAPVDAQRGHSDGRLCLASAPTRDSARFVCLASRNRARTREARRWRRRPRLQRAPGGGDGLQRRAPGSTADGLAASPRGTARPPARAAAIHDAAVAHRSGSGS